MNIYEMNESQVPTDASPVFCGNMEYLQVVMAWLALMQAIVTVCAGVLST